MSCVTPKNHRIHKKRKITTRDETHGSERNHQICRAKPAPVPPLTIPGKTEVTAPIIPNVTADAAPILIETIKLQKKYLSLRCKYAPVSSDSSTDFNIALSECPRGERRKVVRPPSVPAPHDVQEAIFARMEETRIDTTDEMTTMMKDKRQQLETMLQSLLSAIRKNCKDIQRPSKDDCEDNIPTTGCAIGCLEFVLGLIQDETAKIILRHAALCVCRHLLWERHDCRMFFTFRRLKEFVDAIGDADKHLAIHPNVGNQSTVVMYQKEGLMLIHGLSSAFRFGPPTLIIAARYLEEQKGISLAASADSALKRKTKAGMMELRRLRDVALKFADEEVSRIQKMLSKVDSCFEILVPRFGHDVSFPRSGMRFMFECTHEDTANVVEQQVSNNRSEEQQLAEHVHDEDDVGDVDDEEEYIEWEDGIDDNHHQEEQIMSGPMHNDSESHVARVERTLAVMRQSGALSREGTINVSFGIVEASEDHSLVLTATNTSTKMHAHDEQTLERARQVLSKSVLKLSKRQEKIIAWIDAIVSADNMIEASRIRNDHDQMAPREFGGAVSSVIILPGHLRKLKPSVLRKLTNCRNAITAALTAAQRLGIYTNTQGPSEGFSVDTNDNDRNSHVQKDDVESTPFQANRDVFGVNLQGEFGRVEERSMRPSRTSKRSKICIQLKRR